METQFLPWYNLPLINFLNLYLKPYHDVFEYGGGNSTIFYSQKIHQVCTLEIKDEWIKFVNTNKIKNNIEIKKPSSIKNFVEEIENFNLKIFDIIVIDSRDRAQALRKSISHLKENGIIILDNSERENLQSAIHEIKSLGFKQRVFSGIRLDGEISIASVFFKPHAS